MSVWAVAERTIGIVSAFYSEDTSTKHVRAGSAFELSPLSFVKRYKGKRDVEQFLVNLKSRPITQMQMYNPGTGRTVSVVGMAAA